MRQKSTRAKEPAEKTGRDIRRWTRKQYSAEEKIRLGATLSREPGHRSDADAEVVLLSGWQASF